MTKRELELMYDKKTGAERAYYYREWYKIMATMLSVTAQERRSATVKVRR